MKNYIALLFLTFSITIYSQNTLKLDNSKGSPKANLEQVSWISGYWVGEAMGGQTEEVWTDPLGDSMMGSFKIVVNGEVRFYELCTISEVNESLVLRIKHFNNNLTGWEEKDKTIDFPLVKIENNKAFFDDLTFEKINDNELNIYVVIDGKEEVFNYKLKE